MTTPPRAVPLTCHGHSRPITHLSFSKILSDGQYFILSACKDNNPILRNGITGDWIGTFLGHKGAVWSAKISDNVKLAATGSADYTAKIWNISSGSVIHDLQHDSIVRSVAFLPNGNRDLGVLTAAADKKIRLWDFRTADLVAQSDLGTGITVHQNYMNGNHYQPANEIAIAQHIGPIKSVMFTVDNPYCYITAAEEGGPQHGKIRWFDMRGNNLKPMKEHAISGNIGTCDMNLRPTEDGRPQSSNNAAPDPEAAVLTVAAGKSIYFFSGFSQHPDCLLRRIDDLPRDSSCAALDISSRKFVTGCKDDTHVHVYDYDEKTEIDVGRGHHGPVWTTAFSPDGKLYATGSEDGTVKLWKWCEEPYGLWRPE